MGRRSSELRPEWVGRMTSLEYLISRPGWVGRTNSLEYLISHLTSLEYMWVCMCVRAHARNNFRKFFVCFCLFDRNGLCFCLHIRLLKLCMAMSQIA